MTDYKYFSGVGSRQTPVHILTLMIDISKALTEQSYTLRSGHAPGADQAWELGAGANAQIFLPWPQFEKRVPMHPDAYKMFQPSTEARRIAAQHHPYWNKLNDSVKLLITRDVHEVLGIDLVPPFERKSNFMICWTSDGAVSAEETGKGTGGTGQAIRLAEHYDVPIFNLGRPDHLKLFEDYGLAEYEFDEDYFLGRLKT
jgi:hypothetical protein